MNNFTLYPYNKWILIGMIIITVLFLIYLITHVMKLSGTIKNQQEQITAIGKNLELAGIKAEVLAEDKAKKAKQNRVAKMLIPALLAIRSVYQNNENYHGIKGYRKATKDVLTLTPLEKFRKEQRSK